MALLFAAPAFVMYAAFVLVPLCLSVYYSLLRWDGIGKSRFVGLNNYLIVLTDSDLLQIIGNAFQLVAYFTLIPVLIGLAVAAVIREHLSGPFGTVTRVILFLPQVIPLVAAGIAGAGCSPPLASSIRRCAASASATWRAAGSATSPLPCRPSA